MINLLDVAVDQDGCIETVRRTVALSYVTKLADLGFVQPWPAIRCCAEASISTVARSSLRGSRGFWPRPYAPAGSPGMISAEKSNS
jgi:hypothetical protein